MLVNAKHLSFLQKQKKEVPNKGQDLALQEIIPVVWSQSFVCAIICCGIFHIVNS